MATRLDFEQQSFRRVDEGLPHLTRLLQQDVVLDERQQRDLVFALVVLYARNLAIEKAQ